MPDLLKSWLLALVVGIIVACDSLAATPPQKAATIATAIDAAAVLDQIYGPPRKGVWTWTVPADAPTGDGQDLRGHKVEVRSLMSAHFVQGGHERFLVVTGMIDPRNNCHGCETLIGAALYTLGVQRAIWYRGPVAAALALAGSFGRPPEVSFEQLGPEVYGFGTTDRWVGTGETDNRLTLWLARQRGFVPILSVNRLMTGELLSQPRPGTARSFGTIFISYQKRLTGCSISPCVSARERCTPHRILRTRAGFHYRQRLTSSS